MGQSNVIKLGVIAIVLLMSSCLYKTSSSGNSSGSENGNAIVAGVLSGLADTSIHSTLAYLYSDDYGPPLPGDTPFRENLKIPITLNELGEFKVTHIKAGTYNLFVQNEITHQGLFYADIILDGDANVTLGTLIVRRMNTIIIPGSRVQSAGTFFIPGTPLSLEVSENDLGREQIFEAVPQGDYSQMQFFDHHDHNPVLVEANISVSDFHPALLHFEQGWVGQKRIVLDSAVFKSFTLDTLLHFPLLLALDSSFPFDEIGGSPSKFKVLNSKGKSLTYEIQSWNPSEKQGLIWVSIDTLILGGEIPEYFILYGNITPSLISADERQVFSTQAGYLGVWHLDDSLSSHNIQNSVNEKLIGNKVDSVLPIQGVIGGAQWMGPEAFLVVPNPDSSFLDLTEFTLSTWVNIESISLFGSSLIEMRDEYGLNIGPDQEPWTYIVNDPLDGNYSEYVHDTSHPVTAKEWNYIASVYRGDSLLIYLNGDFIKAGFIGKPMGCCRSDSLHFRY